MKKITSALLAAVFIFTPVSAALAATLTATCSGAVSGSNVTWTGQVSGGVLPYAYLWNSGATSSVQTLATAVGTSTAIFQVTDASSTVATTTCMTVVPQSTTVPVSRVQSLHIEDNGQFQAKGMVVKSIGSGSFTAEVYGITYTVNSSQTVTVGNYVDVTGRLKDGAFLTIDARKVKERSSKKILKGKSSFSNIFKHEREDREDEHGRGGGKGRGRGGHDD